MVVRIIRYLLISILGLIVIILVFLFTPAVWRHLVTYPRLEKEVNAFQKRRKEPVSLTKLNTYRGVLHAHSYLSHDSPWLYSNPIYAY